MKDDISIVNTRENVLEFDINIRGGDNKVPDVRFVIEDKGIVYGFICVNEDKDKWMVTIPEMPQLTKKAYPFKLEVVIDGYYFEPYRKSLFIIEEPEVEAGKVVTTKKDSSTKKTKEKPPANKKKPIKNRPEKKKVAVKKKKITKEQLSELLHTPPVEVPIPTEPVDTPLAPADFGDMADTWLNRDRPVVNEQDKKVKDILKGKPVTITVPKEEPVVKEEEKPKIKDKDIQVMDIINSTLKH